MNRVINISKKVMVGFQIFFAVSAMAMDNSEDNILLLQGEKQEIKYCIDDLCQACGAGDLALVQSMVKAGLEIDSKNEFGWTPVYSAVFNNHYDVVKLLIDSGANVNSVVWRNQTPLHYAANNGWSFGFKIVKLLVDSGANVNAKDIFGHTPLYNAAGWPGFQLKNIPFLLEHGAKASSDGKELHNAIHSGNYEGVFLLITHIYKKDIKDIRLISQIKNDKSKIETKFNVQESIKRRWLWRAKQLIEAKTFFCGTTLSLAKKHENKSLFGSPVRLLENIQKAKGFNCLREDIQQAVNNNIRLALENVE